MDSERKSGGFPVIKIDTSFGKDISGDFTLPDYMPEIRRLLFVSSNVLPEGKFISGDVLELDGTLSYNVVYVGDDGSLTISPLTGDYSADCAISAPQDGVAGIFVDTQIESTTCRATGPRSMNIKSRLRFRVTADDAAEDVDSVIDADGVGVDGAEYGIERLERELETVCRRRGSVTESVTGEITSPDGAKPVFCDGTLFVSSAAPGDGGVKVSGQIAAKCLFSGDGGYEVRRCTIPFETVVPIDKDGKFSAARAWGRVASVNVAPSQGDPGAFNVSVEYDLDAEAYYKEETSVCTDAYSRTNESEGEWRELEIPRVIATGAERVTLEGDAVLKGDAEGAEVIDSSAMVCQLAAAITDGTITATGIVRARVLISTGDEIYSDEIELPLKAELADVPDGVAPQDIQAFVTCAVSDPEAKIVSGGLNVKCVCDVTYSAVERQRVGALSSLRLGERREADPSVIKVYYPERDEDVWSVAKKYRADRSRLERNNSFDGGVAPSGKPIIIM